MTSVTRVIPVARGVAWRTVKNALTNPSILIPTFMFPLFFLIAFAGGLSQVKNVPGFSESYSGDYLGFQFTFVLLQAAAFGGVFTGFSIARDFEYGFAKRLFLAAPNRLGIILGYGIAALVRWSLVALVVTLVALIAGMGVAGSPSQLVGLYTLAALLNIAALLWSCGIAMRLRTIQAGPLMQMPVFLILFFAPVYVPYELLQGWIETVARFNPITYVLEAARSLLNGSPEEIGLAFGLSTCLISVMAFWALRGLRRAEAAG